jgi:hypothetical protein
VNPKLSNVNPQFAESVFERDLKNDMVDLAFAGHSEGIHDTVDLAFGGHLERAPDALLRF